MSKIKIFDNKINKGSIKSNHIDVESLESFMIDGSVKFIHRAENGFIDDRCETNKLLYYNVVFRFTNNQELFDVKRKQSVKEIIRHLRNG